MGDTRETGNTGLYLLSFLLIHKYFKAFLTHKAEGHRTSGRSTEIKRQERERERREEKKPKK